MAAENDAIALANARAQLAEEALLLSGSLNLRRTALGLLTLIRPRLADWAILVIPDPVTGGLELFGGNDIGFNTVIERNPAARSALERILRTAHTELRVADTVPAHELSALVPHPALRAEAAGTATHGRAWAGIDRTWQHRRSTNSRPRSRRRFRREGRRPRRTDRPARCDGA